MGTIRINLLPDIREPLLRDIGLALRLAVTSVSAQVHGVAVSIAILCLVYLGPWWSILGLAWRQDGLLHHDLVLIFLVLVLEISPLGQDLHCLDVFDGSQLFSIVLVAAKCVKIDLFAQALILVLDHFKDVVDLFAVKHLLVIHASNRVEDCPHDLRVVNSAKMISDIQTEDNLVQFRLFNSDTLIAKWWWQLSQEVRKSDCPHVKLSHRIVFSPSILECFDILLLKS